jgi:hypothetical protein
VTLDVGAGALEGVALMVGEPVVDEAAKSSLLRS